MWSRFKTALTHPISNSFLPVFRISLGACLVWQIWWYFSSDLIRNYYIDPKFHFTWYFFEWVKPWPGDWMYVHFFVLSIAAFCIMVGFYYRVAAVVFWLGYTHVFLIDKCWYLNHYYLIALIGFISIFLPAERRLSLDAWRKPQIRTDVAPAWTIWLLRAQVGIPYFYGGIAKLNADWLRGEPIRTWLAASTDFPIIGQFFTQEWCVYMFVYGGILIDLLAVPMLLWRRTRVWALVVLTVFHLLNSQLFIIGVFPWMMIALTFIIFSDPSIWERWLPKVHDPSPPRRLSRLVAATLLVFVAVQLVAPLRHWLYPGNVAFTHEAHHFSWRMKLNRRSVLVKYFCEAGAASDRKLISLIPYITGTQERKISDPNMILEMAHFLSEQQSASERGPIYAEATVALNGRPPSPYVDPTVDLTTTSRSLGHADWIYNYPSTKE